MKQMIKPVLLLFAVFLIIGIACKKKKDDQIWYPSNTSLAIITASFPAGTISVLYNASLTAQNGIEPYTWSILGTGDSLPDNIVLDCSSGIISGTEVLVTQRNLVVQVEDADNNSATKNLTLNIYSNAKGYVSNIVDTGRPNISGISNSTDNRYDWGASVLQLDNGMYQMWWTRNDPGNNFDQIQYAKSNDGMNWTNHQMVLQPANTTHENIHTARPSVILVNGTYYMAYESNWMGPSQNSNINFATSSDGISWTKYPKMIPGREAEEIQSIISYYPTHDNDGYGVGQPSLSYINNEFVMYYIDGTSTTGFGVPFNGMRRATTTDPFLWGNSADHPVVMWNAGTQMAYSFAMDRMLATWSVTSSILINPPAVRRMDIYIGAAPDANGNVWNPKAAWHWDNDAYRITYLEPEALTRKSPNFFRDEHGIILEEPGLNSTTFTIIYTDGDLAPEGQDFKITWPTWNLHTKRVTISW